MGFPRHNDPELSGIRPLRRSVRRTAPLGSDKRGVLPRPLRYTAAHRDEVKGGSDLDETSSASSEVRHA